MSNIAFISGLIASVPGVAALLSAPRLGKLGDRVGPEKILICALVISRAAAHSHVDGAITTQLGVLRFCWVPPIWRYCPPFRPCWFYNSTNQIAGRIFSYNQSFRDIGNVTGPLVGADLRQLRFFAPCLSSRRA